MANTKRRSALEDFLESSQPAAPGDTLGQPQPPSVLDQLRVAKPKQRNREYEKKNRSFTYRLTDKELGGKIAAVAVSLEVTADEVARAFVEAGIREAAAGHIPFDKVPPILQRMTLYLTGSETWAVQEQAGWQKPIPARERKKTLTETEKRKRQQELNQYVVAYRWPQGIDQAISTLTEKVAGKAIARSDGRKGWVLTILLRYGLSMYEAGKLPLQPQPKIVKMGLAW